MQDSPAAFFVITWSDDGADASAYRCEYVSASYGHLRDLTAYDRNDGGTEFDGDLTLFDLFGCEEARWLVSCCERATQSRVTLERSVSDDFPTVPPSLQNVPRLRFWPTFDLAGNCRRVVALVATGLGAASEPSPAESALLEQAEVATVRYETRTNQSGFAYVSPEIRLLTGFDAIDLARIGLNTMIMRVRECWILQKEHWRSQSLERSISAAHAGDMDGFRACYQIEDRFGDIRWIQDESQPIRNEKNEFVGNKGILRDVTRRRRAEEALQQERNLSETFFDAVGALVVVLDATGRVLRFNRACGQLSGYSADEVVGRPIWEHPTTEGTQPLVRQFFEAVRMDGVPRVHESDWQTRDGAVRHILWSNTILSDDGRETQILSTGVDVTERRQAERERLQAMSERERAFREREMALAERDRFFDICSTPLVIMALDGSRRRMNPAWETVLGYPLAVAEAMPLSDFFPPDDLQRVGEQLAGLAQGAPVRDFETTVLREDGSLCYLRWEAVPYLDEQLAYATAQDITEERRGALLVQAQNDALRRIASSEPLSDTLQSLLTLVEQQATHSLQPCLLLLNESRQLRMHLAGTMDERLYRLLADAEDLSLAGSCCDALKLRQLNVVADTWTHERFQQIRALCQEWNIRASWSQPLMTSDGRVLGTFAFLRSLPGEPDDWELRLMETAAHLAALAIDRDRAQSSLRQSEARYRSVVEQTTDGVWLVDSETLRVLDANPALLDMLGYNAHEFLQKSLYDIVAQEKSTIDQFTTMIREGGRHNIGQRQYRCKDGSFADVDVNAARIHFNGREAMCMAVRDMRNRSEAERQLAHVMVGARCLLWNAFVHCDSTRQSRYGVRYHWQIRVVNEEAAQRFLPLQVVPHRDYTQAWERSIPISDLLRMNERSSHALDEGRASYSQDFRCYDRSGDLHWFREDVSIEPIQKDRWRAVGVCTDITDRKTAEMDRERAFLERRTAEEERDASRNDYYNLFRNVPTGIYRTTPDGKILMANPAILRMLGYDTFEELAQHNLERHGIHANYPRRDFKDRLQKGGELRGVESNWQRRDGSLLCVRENANVVYDDETGDVRFYEGTVEDVTEWKRAEDMVRWQAGHDALTELPNRFQFQQKLERALGEARRNGQKVALIFLDLDRFKHVNDTLGHLEGDRLLQEVARRLLRVLHAEDTVSRMGGDEFTVLLPHVEDVEDAVRVARKIRRILARALPLVGHELHLTTSIGISLFPQDGDDARTMLRRADIAMYAAKQDGGDRIEVYAPAMEETGLHRLSVESGLRRGLLREEFTLLYQPQFSLESNSPVGVEALVRWRHPEHGLLLPSYFIPIAEETGLVLQLGDWVLREACRQGAYWQSSGRPIRVAVNLSARQLASPDMLARVMVALDETGFSPTLLDLEITESVLMAQGEEALRTLNSLRSLGVRLLLDDFGTGYSSLMYLRRFPLDVLKVDRFFVEGMATGGDEDIAIVRAMIDMAHALKMQCIAEGVETVRQCEILRELKCDAVQGFLLGRPLTTQEITYLLDNDRIAPLFRAEDGAARSLCEDADPAPAAHSANSVSGNGFGSHDSETEHAAHIASRTRLDEVVFE